MKSPTHRPSLAATFAVVIASGCAAENELTPKSTQPVAIPASFEEEGTAWSRAGSMTQPDIDRLTAYFRSNPSVAEHPIINGNPEIYTADGERRRYYWVRAGQEGTEWLYVEFSDRNVVLQEGHGSPLDAD
ncbi:MAG: hypothetical protein DWQ34_22700 [Planctomycetota bacterium]|nr:MAG: hypothetical protein DWQ34_22700 [Planctomycetota bacterium]REK30642.1 MAG: hypothetical protein DWQ41_01450 [Planctomycetota bacterium]REK33016.1 MAG: hypothetical protein DWQ45_15550 [Planctomycetota bacterium]